MTPEQMGALTSAQVRAIETADILALGAADITDFGVAQLQAFTSSQIRALSTSQVEALTLTQIAGLTTQEITWLETADFKAMTGDQVASLTVAQIGAMSTAQVVALDVGDIAGMSAVQSMAFTAAHQTAMSQPQRDAMVAVSPIMLDLDGNGVSTLAASHGVNFDLNATGTASKVGWLAGGDALLVRDINHDGIINDGSELFGAATLLADGSRAGNGYNAMAALDLNHDHKLNAADAAFGELKLWVDANHDGKTDIGELKGLVDMGITELDLSYALSDRMDHGNAVGMISSYKTADGHSHEMADVWFTKAATTPVPQVDELLAPAPTDLVAPAHDGTSQASNTVHTVRTETVTSGLSPHQTHLDDELLRLRAPLF